MDLGTKKVDKCQSVKSDPDLPVSKEDKSGFKERILDHTTTRPVVVSGLSCQPMAGDVGHKVSLVLKVQIGLNPEGFKQMVLQ